MDDPVELSSTEPMRRPESAPPLAAATVLVQMSQPTFYSSPLKPAVKSTTRVFTPLVPRAEEKAHENAAVRSRTKVVLKFPKPRRNRHPYVYEDSRHQPPSFKVEYRKRSYGSYPCLRAAIERVRELQDQNVIVACSRHEDTRTAAWRAPSLMRAQCDGSRDGSCESSFAAV